MNEQNPTTDTTASAATIEALQTMANRLRRHSLLSTSEAGSGHPSSCFSCAEIVSTLFFHFLRYEVSNPSNPLNDRFVLSKGHAAPIYWAAWAEAGAFPVEKLMTLRRFDSDLEGHPTPRNPWADVATGSLGQGLSIGVGMALSARFDGIDNRIYVLMGDGESAEGSVWEAAALAAYRNLNKLVAILDVNRLGQSDPTMYEHDVEHYAQRFSAHGWLSQVIDGHDIEQIIEALSRARREQDRPSVIIARTIKGKGVSFMADKEGWHGKPVPKGELLEQALQEIGNDLSLEQELKMAPPLEQAPPQAAGTEQFPAPEYNTGDIIATRQAYGTGLKKLGDANPRVFGLDGDTKNSTYSQDFMKAHPDRFVECYIAEQNMVGTAVGLSALGKIPFASTFACFLTRGFDQVRMAAISRANLKLCGSHAGISIGQDGPSQMGLEDLAMFRAVADSTVLYPSDPVCTEKLLPLSAAVPGIVYMRTSRPKTPVLYSNQEEFQIGGSKLVRHSAGDRATIVGAGITLHEALKAYETLKAEGIAVRIIDLYSIKPLDAERLREAVRETGCLITVEDHYPEGGLGDAVLGALAGEHFAYRKLAVNGLPRSGKPEELLEAFGINARAIAGAVKDLLNGH